MTEDILASLKIGPADVPDLSASTRNTLIAYLLRWEHYDAARRCLQQLLITHSDHVTIYDELARAYLGLGQPERAVEIMRRRNALKTSASSRVLEARACIAAGQPAEARAIAAEVAAQNPAMLSTYDVEAEVCLAAGDYEGAQAALERRDSLQPESAATAHGLADVWQARGDAEKALLWARTAVSRHERDEHQVPVDLLRLLANLYDVTSQPAQAAAVRARLEERRQQQMEELLRALGLALPTAPVSRAEQAPRRPARVEPGPAAAVARPAATQPPPLDEVPAAEQSRLEEALHRHFPHTAFRPGQAETIAPILRGESVLAVMPTGAGKSLCYQLAALLLPGTALVVSPLIALMKDQLDGLPADVAAQATTLNYTLESSELDARLARAADGGYKLVYAAPERLRQRPFLHALKKAGVSLLVIDEAHCVSLWGHDFRPDYLFIEKAWHELGRPPILAMTATATPRVRDDIQAALGGLRLVATDVHRPNLRLEARRLQNNEDKTRALIELCREIEGSGIVYANARERCEELAHTLRRAGVKAIHYHAGMEDRDAAQDRFMSGQARVVVATIAFGMGIDKPDVRFIIHYHPPRTLENYYQEAGRAGRDGLPARCILFHAGSDKANLTRWTREDALSIEWLRQVYAAVQRRLGAQRLGLVAPADLGRDLATDDETRLRVAIHFLETAGLVWRGFDLPRSATLRLGRPPDGADTELARFVEAARLRPGQSIARDLPAVLHDAGLDPRTAEASLLAWADGGWLEYRGIGRDMLLALPESPPDSRQRVAALLADYVSGQEGRVAEIVGYAGTRLCRHGYISAYFGGRPIQRCQSCDNCARQAARPSGAAAGAPDTGPVLAGRPAPKPQPAGPAVRLRTAAELKVTILEGVAGMPFAIGRTGLTRALRGQVSSPVKADRFPLFGTLAGFKEDQIGAALDQLVEAGLVVTYKKGIYPLLRLTDAGRAWLEAQASGAAGSTAVRVEADPPDPIPLPEDDADDYDRALFERLRAWRRQVAQEIAQPPYVVMPDATLKAIAARLPETVDELAAIKGMGARRIELYGQAVLAVIAGKDGAESVPAAAKN